MRTSTHIQLLWAIKKNENGRNLLKKDFKRK